MATDSLEELKPVVAGDTIKVSCPACGAYTISRPFDTTFQGGEFLVVRPRYRAIKPEPPDEEKQQRKYIRWLSAESGDSGHLLEDMLTEYGKCGLIDLTLSEVRSFWEKYRKERGRQMCRR
jgi:hypothetical protein